MAPTRTHQIAVIIRQTTVAVEIVGIHRTDFVTITTDLALNHQIEVEGRMTLPLVAAVVTEESFPFLLRSYHLGQLPLVGMVD